MAKQYGLSFPKQNTGHKIGEISMKKPSAFDDSDTEDSLPKPTGLSKNIKKQDLISQEKAIADDPTVYQYDEVYDDIEKKRNESKLARKDLDKKPKYINRLLVAAEKRKRENDRRIERQVQKEREEEGDMFKDKESFITPSYKKKLEELRELEEQEKREEYLETIGDVRKQGNLDGFYRHLYDQKVNYDKKNESEVKKTEEPTEISIKEEHISDDDNKNEENNTEISCKEKKERKYRKRRNSADSNSDEPDSKKVHLPSNIDADSDFSVDSSDSEEQSNQEQTKDPDKNEKKKIIKSNENDTEQIQDKSEIIVKLEKEEKIVKIEKEEKIVPKKVKTDVWKKRTVGQKFDEAVKRYFERKAIREMGQ